jgi:GH15 family glucan-1,4-alpha-glucosidase
VFHRFEARPVFGRILSADGFVYRYVTDGVDGLFGEEATFAICSLWLVECLARGGETERARVLFDRLLARSATTWDCWALRPPVITLA